MVDILLRAAPHRVRTERERMQADEIYPESRILRVSILVSLNFVLFSEGGLQRAHKNSFLTSLASPAYRL